jgi:hypothetical protein
MLRCSFRALLEQSSLSKRSAMIPKRSKVRQCRVRECSRIWDDFFRLFHEIAVLERDDVDRGGADIRDRQGDDARSGQSSGCRGHRRRDHRRTLQRRPQAASRPHARISSSFFGFSHRPFPIQGAQTFAIGITNAIDKNQLVAIAGSNDSVIFVDDFSKLDATARETLLSKRKCVTVTRKYLRNAIYCDVSKLLHIDTKLFRPIAPSISTTYNLYTSVRFHTERYTRVKSAVTKKVF